MSKLSVIIITKNEQDCIGRCLASVKWADEIIVLDSGSSDDTVKICYEYTNHVYSTDWPGFGPQKNRALEKASGDWVLSIDADEWLTDELSDAIKNTLQSPTANGYSFPRRNIYWGKIIKHGDPGSDDVLRLFKRHHGKFSDDIVHERLIVDGNTATIKAPLMHDTYSNFEDMLERINRYTTLTAEKRFKQGKKASVFKAFTHSLWAFIKSYFIRGGILDGAAGFMVAVSSAESCYYRYVKLWLLLQKQK